MRLAAYTLLLTLVCAVSSFSAPAPQQQSDDEPLVNSAFPSALENKQGTRFFVHQRADLDGTGAKNYIVAVYTNGREGVVRVLRQTDGSVEVAGEAHERSMRGFTPVLRLIDIDGDGIPEIIASFIAMGGENTWPFRWDHGRLALIEPSEKSPANALAPYFHVDFRDVDGDGALELVHWLPDSADPEVLKLSGGAGSISAKRGKRIVASSRFEKESDDGERYRTTFRAPAGAKLVITVVNGDVYGRNRAPKGDLYLNGTPLLLHNDINETTRTFTVSIVASSVAVNELELSLEGGRNAEVTVTIAPQQ